MVVYFIIGKTRNTSRSAWKSFSNTSNADKSIFMFAVSIPQILKRLPADNMLHPTGIPFRCSSIYSRFSKKVRKKLVLLIGPFSDFPANVGQVEEKVLIHDEKSIFPQGRHRMAYTCLLYTSA